MHVHPAIIIALLFVGQLTTQLSLWLARARSTAQITCTLAAATAAVAVTYYLTSRLDLLTLALVGLYFLAFLTPLADTYRNKLGFATHLILSAIFTALLMCMLVEDVVSLYALWAISSVLIAALLARSGDVSALEACVKYLVFSSIGLAILTVGLSLAGISLEHNLGTQLLVLSFLLLLYGVLYEVGLVPLHLWVPDVYTGSDKLAVAYLASQMKILCAVVLARLLEPLLPHIDTHTSRILMLVLAVLAVLTMTLGNVSALTAEREEQILAFSTIAHTGYAVAALSVALCRDLSPEIMHEALAVFLYQLLASAVSKYVLFKALLLPGGSRLTDFVVFTNVLSLIGIPPLLGFWPKLLILWLVLEAGLVWVAIAIVVNTAISVVYYVRLFRMYRARTGGELGRTGEVICRISVTLGTALVIILGLVLTTWFIEKLSLLVTARFSSC